MRWVIYIIAGLIVISWIVKFFIGRQESARPTFSDEENQRDYDLKKQGLEKVLGKMDDMVLHAIIPYEIGGPLDIYTFSKHLAGTGFVSMELLSPADSGPKANRDGTYELIMFTRLKDGGENTEDSPYSKIALRCRSIMTSGGRYSTMAVLNSGDTSEVPISEDEFACIILDKYTTFSVGERTHHLLLIMEVFRNEMEYARKEGTEKLLLQLKEQNYYPFSDLDRKSVIE